MEFLYVLQILFLKKKKLFLKENMIFLVIK
jgi:hypothetical protein